MDFLEKFRDRLDTLLSIESNGGVRQCTKETLTEDDLVKIGNLLRHGATTKPEWAKRPRLFAILYIIGCMDYGSIMDDFVRLGYKDSDLPFGDPLPSLLKSYKARFKENQHRILTGANDLEKGSGHQHFQDGSKYYSEEKVLGHGLTCYVYEVFSQQSFEKFARKTFHKPKRPDEALRMSKIIAEEIQHLKKLSHRHLVKFIGSYTDMKYIAILMQPVARCDLEKFLTQTPLPSVDGSRLPCYFGCLANALQYLHAESIKHKDLKPQNILISSQGRVLITDFGSATSFQETGQSTTMGSDFTMTLDYAPREVVEFRPRNTKADVYSLGAVFFEMWTVMKGKSIDAMRVYFLKNGTLGRNIRTNRDAAAGWTAQLIALRGDPSLNEPIKYIQRMILDEPKERPDMDEIVLDTIGAGQTSMFCCPECMAEYTNELTLRRHYAHQFSPIMPRSNSAIPEKASQPMIADLTPIIERARSAMGDIESTIQPAATFDSSHQEPTDAQPIPKKLEAVPAISTPGNPITMDRLRSAASQFGPHGGKLTPYSPAFMRPVRKSASIQITRPDGEALGILNYHPRAFTSRQQGAGMRLDGIPPMPPLESTTPQQTHAKILAGGSNAINEPQAPKFKNSGGNIILSTSPEAVSKEEVKVAASAELEQISSGKSPDTNLRYEVRPERDIASAFKAFATQQRQNIEQSRISRARIDKEIKLADLKQFAGKFRLTTEVPEDLLPVIAKDPARHKEIQDRAKYNAEKARVDDVFRKSASKPISPAELPTSISYSKDHKILPLEMQIDSSVSRIPLPFITEVPDKAWAIPEEFDWTYKELTTLIRLKRSLLPKDFRKTIVDEFPSRSGSNVKKFWITFCQTNKLRPTV